MAKKKEKKKPVPPSVKLKRRIKKYSKRAAILALVLAGYFFALPAAVPSSKPQVEQTKLKVLSLTSQARRQMTEVLGTATQLTMQLTARKEEFTELGEEGAQAAVQETVDDLTERVKALPGEELKKVKREFCADVIEEALSACQATQSGEKKE